MDTVLNEVQAKPAEGKPKSTASLWIYEQDVIRPFVGVIVQDKLSPGTYTVDITREYGLYCKKMDSLSDELFILSDSLAVPLLEEVDIFFGKKDTYKEFNLVHKRGILLEGASGVGKTSLVEIISRHIIDKGGVVFKLTAPKNLLYYVAFLKDNFRAIEKSTPILTVIEDIDTYNDYYPELLEFLDGKGHLDHHIILATTSNSEAIDESLLRPSRIDLRVEVDFPSETARREYFQHKNVPEKILDAMVEVSEGFSMADLKELYICIFVLEYDPAEAQEKIGGYKRKKDYSGKFQSGSSMSI